MKNNNTSIVDVNGIPFKMKEIEQKQSNDNAQVGQLKHEFAEHPSRGLSPAKLAGIMLEAEHGNIMMQADLADDMEEKDGHIFAELDKRKRAILTVPWSIKPPRNATEAEKTEAALVNEILLDANCMEDILFDMADGILKGFSNIEMAWEQRDGLMLPTQFERMPQRSFMVNPDNQNELRLRDQSAKGAELRSLNWIQHRHKSKSGYVARANLIRVLAWPYLFKNYSVRDLAEFLEIYGIPARIGKYPIGADKAEKNSLLQAIMSIGHNAGGIIPKGMEIEFEKAASGQADPFELMISWCEKTQSKIILGSTLTSQADGKSSTNALGNVHEVGRIELRNSDAKQFAATLTRDLVMPIQMLNGKSYNPRRLMRFEFDVQEAEDLSLYSEALPKLAGAGMKIPLRWLHDKLQIPQAEKDEDVMTCDHTPVATQPNETGDPKSKPAKPNKPTKLSANKLKLAITALAAITEASNDDAVDQQSAQLAAALSPQVKALVNEVESLVNNASSLEVLQAQLLDLELPIDDMAKVMQLALSSSQLMGMVDVEQGN